jgi:hypothetical protein
MLEFWKIEYYSRTPVFLLVEGKKLTINAV